MLRPSQDDAVQKGPQDLYEAVLIIFREFPGSGTDQLEQFADFLDLYRTELHANQNRDKGLSDVCAGLGQGPIIGTYGQGFLSSLGSPR